MYPWVCTAPGCKQTKNWNLYTKCKDCNAVRLTPPLTKLPGTQEPTDWEAKYKALEAKTKKEKPTDQQKDPTIVRAKIHHLGFRLAVTVLPHRLRMVR